MGYEAPDKIEKNLVTDNAVKEINYLMPDAVQLNVGFNAIGVAGGGLSFNATWLVGKGDYIPMFSITESVGLGLDASTFGSVAFGYFTGVGKFNYASLTGYSTSYSFGGASEFFSFIRGQKDFNDFTATWYFYEYGPSFGSSTLFSGSVTGNYTYQFNKIGQ
jgi:hypothetical protein